jgi:hypothetical protein
MHESNGLCAGHSKLEIWTVLLANLWLEIDLVKGIVESVALHKSCKIWC